ncbi:hypothetical protein ppKF707_4892 [Metapseudomonas furukawaii]|uniref:Uncharacterized protein n=1 Tax=Metapseudomonas furukawaii TaxID=1149133 RepID=A0AAD1FHE8_METFU|nr:hypothetical protein ppKF707_4892 [Pseudomonas furukawaii]BAU75328.1 hypothetical protein KF707C_36400 [Pseudomonas furukawaii]
MLFFSESGADGRPGRGNKKESRRQPEKGRPDWQCAVRLVLVDSHVWNRASNVPACAMPEEPGLTFTGACWSLAGIRRLLGFWWRISAMSVRARGAADMKRPHRIAMGPCEGEPGIRGR